MDKKIKAQQKKEIIRPLIQKVPIQPIKNIVNENKEFQANIVQSLIQPFQPIIHREIQPIIREVQPIIHREIQPIIQQEIREIQPLEVQPMIQREIQPMINIVPQKITNRIIIEEKEDKDESEEENNTNEIIDNKCSLDEHKDINALFYCQECRVKMCNKCEKIHSGLLKKHHIYSLDKDIKEVFTGLCTNNNHSLELEIYCKNHNKLCCVACISKIKIKGKGQHKNCEVYHISKIKNNKKENLEKNIKHLEEISNKLEPSIKELKNIFEKINQSKEKLKTDIQKIFTKIRTELNNREDKLYEEIDKIFEKIFFNEELIKESEKLPNLVKLSLEKGQIKEDEWKNEKRLIELINHCINIENTIIKIDSIYNKIQEYNSTKDTEIDFEPKSEDIENNLINEIKKFGNIKVLKNNNIDNNNILIKK